MKMGIKGILGLAMALAFSSNEAWSAGPNSYSSRNDTAILNSKPPAALTGLVGAGHKYSDPQFGGNYVIRVTDGNTFQNAGSLDNTSFLTPAASEDNAWNYNSNAFMISTYGGQKLLYKWDPVNMVATRMDNTSDGGGVITDKNGIYFAAQFFGYTAADNNALFGVAGTKFYKYTIDMTKPVWNSSAITASVIQDANAANCLNGKLDGYYGVGDFGLDASDNRGAVVFNHSTQNSAFYAVVFDRAKGGCRWFNTLTGKIGGAFGGSTSSTVASSFPNLPSPAAPVVSNATGGSLIAGHSYRITFTRATRQGETSPSPATTFKVGSGYNAISVAPPAQPSWVTPQTFRAFNVYMCDATMNSSCAPVMQSSRVAPAGVKCSAVKTGTAKTTYWVVAQFADGGESIPSAPCVVSNSAAGINRQNNDISWSPVTGATSYYILKDSLTQILGPPAIKDTSFSDNGVFSAVNAIATQMESSGNAKITKVVTTSPKAPMVNTAGFTMHNIKVDKSGKWAKITVANGNGGHPTYMLWQIDTNTVIPADSGSQSSPIQVSGNVMGHQALGYGKLFSQSGFNGNADFTSHILETPGLAMDTSVVHMIDWSLYQVGGSSWGFVGDQHMSYNNGGPLNTQPLIASTDPVPGSEYGPYAGPIAGEIIGVPQGPNAKIYRFCHNWSSGAVPNFWASPRGNVSQDGKWFIFTSDMQVNNQGVGVGSSAGASTCTSTSGSTNCRTDVFICELR
jgi:hypothetical protein